MLTLISALLIANIDRDELPRRLPHLNHAPDDRIHHFECFNIVRAIDRETHAGKTPEEITTALSTHCDRLDDVRKNICVSIIPNRVPRILELMAEKKGPDAVCEALGFSRSFGGGRLIAKDQCVKYVDLVREDHAKNPKGESRSHIDPKDAEKRFERLGGNSAGEQVREFKKRHQDLREDVLGKSGNELDSVKEGLRHRLDAGFAHPGPGVCKDLDHEQRLVCHVVSRLVLRGMIEELESGMDSGEICKKLEEKHLIKLADAPQ
jgi:hypothetical protein